MALFDENDRVSLPTLDYFSAVGNMNGLSGPKGAAMGFRLGMAVAMRHPEYAQAYLRMTDTPDLDVDNAEGKTLDGFVRMIPVAVVTKEQEAD